MDQSVQHKEDLRAAVQHAVMQLCSQEDANSNVTTAPHAVAAISELAYGFATESLRVDLDAFSAHAGRRTINSSDVLLALRKNGVQRQRLGTYLSDWRQMTAEVGANSKRAQKKVTYVNLQKKNRSDQENHANFSESSDSSSDEEMELNLSSKTKSRLPLLDESSEDEIDVRPPSKERPTVSIQKNTRVNIDSSDESSDDDLTLSTAARKRAPKAAPKTGLNFLGRERNSKPTKKKFIVDSDSDSSNNFLEAPKTESHSKRTSRLQEFMEGLSDDSVC